MNNSVFRLLGVEKVKKIELSFQNVAMNIIIQFLPTSLSFESFGLGERKVFFLMGPTSKWN